MEKKNSMIDNFRVQILTWTILRSSTNIPQNKEKTMISWTYKLPKIKTFVGLEDNREKIFNYGFHSFL